MKSEIELANQLPFCTIPSADFHRKWNRGSPRPHIPHGAITNCPSWVDLEPSDQRAAYRLILQDSLSWPGFYIVLSTPSLSSPRQIFEIESSRILQGASRKAVAVKPSSDGQDQAGDACNDDINNNSSNNSNNNALITVRHLTRRPLDGFYGFDIRTARFSATSHPSHPLPPALPWRPHPQPFAIIQPLLVA